MDHPEPRKLELAQDRFHQKHDCSGAEVVASLCGRGTLFVGARFCVVLVVFAQIVFVVRFQAGLMLVFLLVSCMAWLYVSALPFPLAAIVLHC